VTAAGEGAFDAPETALFRWTREMRRDDLVALAGTYSAVITTEEGARRAHLAGMARYLRTLEAFAGRDTVDVPMRSYCWRATRR
jgi:hypothetical protein